MNILKSRIAMWERRSTWSLLVANVYSEFLKNEPDNELYKKEFKIAHTTYVNALKHLKILNSKIREVN